MRMEPNRRRRRPVGPFLILPFLMACATAAAVPGPVGRPPPPQEASETRPRLMVFLVVDQLRGDLLDRYAPVFTGGLKRLLDQGRVYTDAVFRHAATGTAPGHATLSTAVFPSRAGIPSNAWKEKEGTELEPVYNVVDPRERIVGIPGVPGASPRVLRRTGLADWARTADPDARVVSISAKDRAAVLMAGMSKGDVYWFDAESGQFVTSTFYQDVNPPWLKRFNKVEMRTYRADTVWTSTIPPGTEDLSSPDTAVFEGDGIHTFFPHRYVQERIDPDTDDFFLWFEGTPMLDRATLDFSRLVIRETGIGRTPGRTDYLSISLSQTDRVGHEYGPLSREQMDNLLRLDRDLGGFLDFLDDQVGEGSYVLGLTGDHGVMTVPERLEGGRRLGLVERSDLELALSLAARKANRAGENGPGSFMVEAMADLSFVGPTYTHETLSEGEPHDSLEAYFRHSFVPGRAGGLLSVYGVEMWWAEDVISWSLPRGTTHGGPFIYDRWVPLILFGPGVTAGRVDDPIMPIDLGPTLAWLSGIPFPDDLDGSPLPLGSGSRIR